MIRDLFYTEWMKLRCSVVRVIMLIVPLFINVVGLNNYVSNLHVFRSQGMVGWMGAWTQVEFLYGMVLLPVLIGVYVALICRFEHIGGGWKQLLAFPVSWTKVYLTKMLWAWLLIGLTNIVVFFTFFVLGKGFNVEGDFPAGEFLLMFLKGWFATITLIALLTWVSTQWKNFGLPIALNFAFVILPNPFISNDEIGRFYPWSQSIYAMTPTGRLFVEQQELLFYLIIVISFVLFLAFGLWRFHRSELK